jgi:hypothetical protein
MSIRVNRTFWRGITQAIAGAVGLCASEFAFAQGALGPANGQSCFTLVPVQGRLLVATVSCLDTNATLRVQVLQSGGALLVRGGQGTCLASENGKVVSMRCDDATRWTLTSVGLANKFRDANNLCLSRATLGELYLDTCNRSEGQHWSYGRRH